MVEKILLLYSPFWTSQNLQLGTNVTWHDAYRQKHDENFKIESIFNYQMPYWNTKEMNDLIYSKSKPLHPIDSWNDDINNKVNDSCPAIPIINIINIEPYDLRFDFVIHSCNISNQKSQTLEDENFTKFSYSMMMEKFEYCNLLRQLNEKKD